VQSTGHPRVKHGALAVWLKVSFSQTAAFSLKEQLGRQQGYLEKKPQRKEERKIHFSLKVCVLFGES
jgi:hypothetical protein